LQHEKALLAVTSRIVELATLTVTYTYMSGISKGSLKKNQEANQKCNIKLLLKAYGSIWDLKASEF